MAYTIYYPYTENKKDITPLTPLKEGYGYMWNSVHVLQTEPSDKEIELVKKYAPEVGVIYSETLDTFFICILGAGMDVSASVELAYLIIDGKSPVKGDPYYFDEKRKKLLEEFRKDPEKAKEEMFKRRE